MRIKKLFKKIGEFFNKKIDFDCEFKEEISFKKKLLYIYLPIIAGVLLLISGIFFLIFVLNPTLFIDIPIP